MLRSHHVVQHAIAAETQRLRLADAGAPWTDQPVVEWLNSVLLELYRGGMQPGLKIDMDARRSASHPVMVQSRS